MNNTSVFGNNTCILGGSATTIIISGTKDLPSLYGTPLVNDFPLSAQTSRAMTLYLLVNNTLGGAVWTIIIDAMVLVITLG